MHYSFSLPLGATRKDDGTCQFYVWAPNCTEVRVHVVHPSERVIDLKKDESGYHFGELAEVEPGTLYLYNLDAREERPDPASRYQPQGVHGPSAVVDPSFLWANSSWKGLKLEDYVLYELHVGAFTQDGTFDAVVPHLDRLKELGITAIELMPVAQFPGNRNWGYDGVYPFAVQNSYGGPEALKRLVDECHRREMAVVLDVVYNHLGPEGNYLADFGPYFTDRYPTPWGQAINFDGPHSDEVRRFFIENALYWVTEFRIDALRIDAVHGIFDFSAVHFLTELGSAIHSRAEELHRSIHVIAESDLNNSRLIRPRDVGGYGLDGQWNDDFHHALHALLTGERAGYYADFGRLSDLTKAFKEGFVFSGEYSAFRRRRHGNSSAGTLPRNFVVFSQNHDQVGNRMMGDRLGRTASFEQLKLAAGVVLLSPYVPLLFMGEEYGEVAPFPYFVSHSDAYLIEAVRKGRIDEFAAFRWMGTPMDPQDEFTFACAKLNHELRHQDRHASMYRFYEELLRLRKAIRSATGYGEERGDVTEREEEQLLLISLASSRQPFVVLFHFGKGERIVKVPMPAGSWKRALDSAESLWGGPGSLMETRVESDGLVGVQLQPHSVAVFFMEVRDE
jgi:maltooligosyltrehalose trehalohydrolase